ncbi:MAG: RNA polymerase factor sigma-54 [Planctomycetes bacterium]|nr:RNA polymerase factor sigma-54 [Planctomycetota bacterium]
MALELRLNQKLDLQLKLSPQIIQSIEILQLPTVDLQDLVQQELDTNEYLETAAQAEPPVETTTPADAPTKEGVDREAEFETLEAQGFWDEEMPRFKSALDYEASDRKQEAMNNTAGRGPSMHEYLLEQFALIDLDERYRELGENIILNINPQGRLDVDLQTILDQLQGPDDEANEAQEYDDDRLILEDAEYVLSQVQSLEPRGIAARTTEECLLLQLEANDPRHELKRRLISDHLEDLSKNRRPKISKILGIDFEELDDLVQELASLDYQPGASAVEAELQYIYPDIIVDYTPDGYVVRLAQNGYSSIQVDDGAYQLVMRDDDTPQESKQQAREQYDKAKLLVQAIAQRQETLLRVARRIVHYQYDFLEFGPHYLQPLKMQQIADDLGIHVSTVSRATHEKYMQTHRGIFSLKSFFSGATQSVDGGVESRSSVRQRVKEIIDSEDKLNPLSDEEIVTRLKESFGVQVARRTVTKYRKALGLPSTRQRRIYE